MRRRVREDGADEQVLRVRCSRGRGLAARHEEPEREALPGAAMKHIVFYSGGKASFLAASRVIEWYGAESVTLLFTDTMVEDTDLYRFLDESSAALGVPVTRIADGRTIWQVFSDSKFLGNNRVPLCSRILKQEVAQKWVDANCDPSDTTLHFGIDWTEEHRMISVRRVWRDWKCESPLLVEPLVEKDAADALLKRLGIAQPRLYALGASHNNCGGLCVRAGQGAFAWGLKAIPEVYAEWERNEERLRDQLGDVAILRDRRGGTSKPLPLVVLRARIANTPEQIDMFDIGGCGCFVEDDEDSPKQEQL